MALKTTKEPDELLVRWGDDGAVRGAHVRWRYTVKNGATVVSVSIGDAEPVALAGGAGFPLADILGQVHVDALRDMDSARAERDAAIRERDEARAALSTGEKREPAGQS